MAEIEKRKTKKGDIRYRVKIRLKGYPTQYATFTRLTDARRWEQQTESAIREGRHFKTTEAKKHTLSEAINKYIKSILPAKPKSYAKLHMQLTWWEKQIGSYSLADITPARIGECRDDLANGITFRGKQRSRATVNRYLAALSHVFTIAMKEWGWIEINPLDKVTKFKEPKGRSRFLSDGERQRLLKACKESKTLYLYLAVVLALSTGARRMEVFGLRWEHVDFKRSVITLHETKNGERRILPLTGYALDLMREYAEQFFPKKEGWVFPSKNMDQPVDPRKAWENALQQAEISDFRFHDLRHSAASYLAMSGATLAEIAEVLGHKTLQMVKRYAHFSDSHVSKVVAKMNAKIFDGLSE